jgi:hypothetical protein
VQAPTQNPHKKKEKNHQESMREKKKGEAKSRANHIKKGIRTEATSQVDQKYFPR